MPWCHPVHAMRTKCACGRVVELAGAIGDTVAKCKCGRKHSKHPGNPFGEATYFDKNGCARPGGRAGGRRGCPGEPLFDHELMTEVGHGRKA